MAITIVSTMMLMADEYFVLTSVKEVDRTLFYLVIPVLLIRFVFRQPLKAFGFQIGDWRNGLLMTASAVLILAPVLWIAVRHSSETAAYYQSQAFTMTLFWLTLLELIGWEFFFRGFVLFGYQMQFGDHALWLQAVPFALAHLGKPALETLTTLFSGFLFGLVAKKTRSFIYPCLIHLFVALFTRYAALTIPSF
jgi:hypothetical protein